MSHVNVRARTCLALSSAFACEAALAQFGATGQARWHPELIMSLPWAFIVLVVLLNIRGPTGLRAILSKALKQAFGAGLIVIVALLIVALVSRMTLGIHAVTIAAGVFFCLSLLFSGAVISAFTIISLGIIAIRAAMRHTVEKSSDT